MAKSENTIGFIPDDLGFIADVATIDPGPADPNPAPDFQVDMNAVYERNNKVWDISVKSDVDLASATKSHPTFEEIRRKQEVATAKWLLNDFRQSHIPFLGTEKPIDPVAPRRNIFALGGMGGFDPGITRKTAPDVPVRPVEIGKEVGKGLVRFTENVAGSIGGTAQNWLGQFIEKGGKALDDFTKLGVKNKDQIYNPYAEAIMDFGRGRAAIGRESRRYWSFQAQTGWEALDPQLKESDPVSYGAGRLSEGVASSALSVLAVYMSGGAAAGPALANKGIQINRGLLALSGLSAAGGFEHAQAEDENFLWSTAHGLADGTIEYVMESTFLEGVGRGKGALTAGFKEGSEEFFTGMLQNTRAGILENEKAGMSAYEGAKDAIVKSLQQSPWEIAAGFIGGYGIQGGANMVDLTKRANATPLEGPEEGVTEPTKAPTAPAKAITPEEVAPTIKESLTVPEGAEGIEVKPAEVAEDPEVVEVQAQVNMAQAGGISTEKVTPNLYIGNVTPGMKKRIAAGSGLSAEDIQGFKEGGFPTKRTKIEMTRAEATNYLDFAITELSRQLEANEINTESELSKAQSLVGDIKTLQDTLGLTVQPAQFTVKRAKKPRTAITKAGEISNKRIREITDKLAKGETLTEQERADMVVALEQQKVATKAVAELTTKQAIKAAIRPQDIEDAGMTTLEVFNAVMKGQSKESQRAFIAGARETVKQHKNLAELAKLKLENLNITEGQRKQLLNAVSRARTDAQQVVAMASVQRIADKANFTATKADLQKAIKEIPKFGKTLNVRQPAIDRINAALEGVDLTALSDKKRVELEAIQKDLLDVGFQLEEGIANAPEEEVEGVRAVVGDKVLAQLRRLGKTPLAEMKPEEIQSIADSVRYAVTQNALQNKLIREKETQDAIQVIKKANTQIAPTRRATKRTGEERIGDIGILERGGRIVTKDSLHIHGLVDVANKQGDSEMRRILDTERHAGVRKSGEAQFESIDALKGELDRIGWNDTDIKRSTKEHSVILGGKRYKLTTSEIMSLGMNIKSERNLNELNKTKGLFIGRRKVKRPTVGEVVDAVGKLTDKERAVMDYVSVLNEEHLMPQLNEVSDVLMGGPLARDVNYWGLKRKLPRHVRGRTTTVDGGAIEDIGMFQPFLGSSRRMNIVPFWDQLISQIQNVAAYNGQAIPMRNARTLLNNESWQESMVDAGREAEMQNLHTMFTRIQGTVSDKTAIDFAGQSLLSAAGQSILGLRLSTMLVQPASLPMAFSINGIPAKYAKPISGVTVQRGAVQSKRIDEFSAPLRLRHEGGRTNIVTGDIGAADSVNRLIFGKKNLAMEGMHKTDRFAIQAIDRSVQRWVADTTDLEFGSDEFWTEVAHRTEDIVRKTQPMWDMGERSVLSSSPNFVLRSMLMFRSAREAMLNQNIIAIDNIAKATDKVAASRDAAKTLGATTLSTVMVRGMKTALYAGTTLAATSLLDREPKEDVISGEKFVEDIVTDMFGHLPFGSVVSGTLKKAMGKQAWNELDPDAILVATPAMLADGAQDFTKAYEAWFIDEDADAMARHLISGVNNTFDALARLKGVPASGIMQVTTQPLERALKQPPSGGRIKVKSRKRILLEAEERTKELLK